MRMWLLSLVAVLGLVGATISTSASEDNGPDPIRLQKLAEMGKKGDAASIQELLKVAKDEKLAAAERDAAIKALPLTKDGGMALLAWASAIPEEFKTSAAMALASCPDAGVKAQAALVLPLPTFKDGKTIPPINELAALKGDAKNGAKIFRRAEGPNCISCHQIGEEGPSMVGPPLTVIGDKLGKEALYDSIISPSGGILMGYENWNVKVKGKGVVSGRLTEDTEDHITILNIGGQYIDIPAADVQKKLKLSVSLMPDGLGKTMTQQEFVDLVEYMVSLKQQ